jgi:hypothetical protein
MVVLLLWVSIFISIPIIFFLSTLSTLSPSSSNPYSHPLTLPPSPVLKCIAPLPNTSLLTQSLPEPSPYSLILPQPVARLPLPPTHSSPTDQLTIPTLHNPKSLKSLTKAPCTTTEIHLNTHKDHKNQQPPHCLLHSPTPLPTSPSSATLSNSPNFCSDPYKC